MIDTAILDVQEISVQYGNVLALERVSLQVGAGELVCLLGGNASGKTTTMRAILGIVRPHAGHIRFRGHEISSRATSDIIRAGIAMVPENRELFPTMTVEENLRLGAYNRRDRDAIEADLEGVLAMFPHVRDLMTQAAGTLSGGEQQMVAFGRALMAEPTLILMDEPSMGLAPVLVKQTFAQIERLREAGRTVLLVEQNANASLAIADRAYVLQTGRIVLEGSAAELARDDRLRTAYLG